MDSQPVIIVQTASTSEHTTPDVVADPSMPPPVLPQQSIEVADDSPSPTPTRTISATSRQAPKKKGPPKKKAKAKVAKAKSPRLVWRPEMTVAFLEYLAEAGAEGKLDSRKLVYVKPVVREIMEKMKEKWPQDPWDVGKMMTYYKALKFKHRQFISIAWKSGATYDNDTGMVNASDSLWETYDAVHGDSGAWLKSVGLPKPDLYATVFTGNRVGGESAVEASDFDSIETIDLIRSRTQEDWEEEDEKYLDSCLDTASEVPTPIITPSTSLKRTLPSDISDTPSMQARRARRSATTPSDTVTGTITGSLGALAARYVLIQGALHFPSRPLPRHKLVSITHTNSRLHHVRHVT